jgi:uncharacterized protein (DUF4415 family)|tara:strand:+ start:42 stop:770 length:729 start_codon:yes stop_codon:yes gene_type:complete
MDDEYDWQTGNHPLLNSRVARSFFDESKALRFTHGCITKWLPPEDEDEALFHMVHEDGDEEDLNEAELMGAISLYKQTTLHIGDPVIVNWRGKGKWWHGRIADVQRKIRKGKGKGNKEERTVNVYNIRYDDGDTEKNVAQKNIYKRFAGDTSKSVAIVPDPKEGGSGIHLIPVSGIRASPREVEGQRSLPSYDKNNPHKHTLKYLMRPSCICDLCETSYGANYVWRCESCDYDLCDACVTGK